MMAMAFSADGGSRQKLSQGALGGLRKRVLSVEGADLLPKFRKNVRPHLLDRQGGLGQQYAGRSITRTGEAQIQISKQDLALAAEEAGLSTFQVSTPNGQ